MCSLAAQASAGWSTMFTGEVIGRDQLELWARGLERFIAVRARHDPARFFDVGYDEFVADPVRTVEAIYARFGLTLSAAARTPCGRCTRRVRRRRQAGAPLRALRLRAHRWQVDERFGPR